MVEKDQQQDGECSPSMSETTTAPVDDSMNKQDTQTSSEDGTQMDDFRRVANDASRGLVASEEKSRVPAMCAEPYSTWRCFCLVMLMVCFVAATPLSLVLTIPAYILADRADMLSEQGFKRQSHIYCLVSVILNVVAGTAAVAILSTALFLYAHLAS